MLSVMSCSCACVCVCVCGASHHSRGQRLKKRVKRLDVCVCTHRVSQLFFVFSFKFNKPHQSDGFSSPEGGLVRGGTQGIVEM